MALAQGSSDHAHYGVVVIGSGPAGQRAAIASVKSGRRTLMIEKRSVVGGTCINTGTIPSKAFREAPRYWTIYRPPSPPSPPSKEARRSLPGWLRS